MVLRALALHRLTRRDWLCLRNDFGLMSKKSPEQASSRPPSLSSKLPTGQVPASPALGPRAILQGPFSPALTDGAHILSAVLAMLGSIPGYKSFYQTVPRALLPRQSGAPRPLHSAKAT